MWWWGIRAYQKELHLYDMINKPSSFLRIVEDRETKKNDATDKTFSLEEQEILISALRVRFLLNEKNHPTILWGDIEKSLRAQPEFMWSLQQLESTGGEPDVIREEENAFIFGDVSEESPYGRRNVVFDAEAEEWLKKNSPDEICHSNAADTVAEWGVDFMSDEEYRDIQQTRQMDVLTYSWLKTPLDTREENKALSGDFNDERVRILECDPCDHDANVGFRCSLTVPKIPSDGSRFVN
jgi:hypothetical protein